MKTIQVKFNVNPALYSYIYALDEPIKVGDIVVVDSPISGRLELVTVMSLDGAYTATKYIVDKVDTTKYKAQVERDKQIATLKKELDKRMKLVEAKVKYQLLADMDVDAATLLRELTQLENNA